MPLPEFDFVFDTEQVTPEIKVESEVEAEVDPKVEDEVIKETQTQTDNNNSKTEDNTEVEPENTLDEQTQAHYQSLVNFYKDEGLVQLDEETPVEIKSKEDFANILREQRIKERQALEENLISNTPEYGQDIMEYLLTEGNQLTVDKLKSFLDIKETTEQPIVETEEEAREYLKNIYTTQHDEDTALVILDGLEDKGILVDKAKELQAKDKEEAEAKLAETIEESKKSKQEALQQQKTFVHNLTKELNGTGWEGSIQSEIYTNIINGGLRNKTQAIVNYPKALIGIANFLRFFDEKTGKLNVEDYVKSMGGNTKAVNKIKNNIDKNFGTPVISSGTTRTMQESDNSEYEFA
jgi:hypothetical protein